MCKIYMFNCPTTNDKEIVEEVNKYFHGAVEKSRREKGTLYISLDVHSGYNNMMKSFADKLQSKGLILEYGIW